MPHSMTAFAQCTDKTEWGELACELRSVNHRYLDVNFRLSEEIRSLEPALRARITDSFKRGRIDCTLRLRLYELVADESAVDGVLAEQVIALARRFQEKGPELQPLQVIDVMRWPGVLRVQEVDAEALRGATMGLLEETISEVQDIRKREGGRLQEIVREKLNALAAAVAEVKAVLPQTEPAFRNRLEERLKMIREEIDQNRFEQEVLFYLQKSDVSEEIDRLTVHLDEAYTVIASEKPIGRRLDFLMQELHREANTFGAKAFDARLTGASVELKLLIEQMREQVQNIE